MNDVIEQTRQPVDAEARSRALDITGSFAVSAPAGSGKTGLLTQRVLKLLAACQQPEEVLAITFTRKAAGEMRERLLEALHSARNSERPDNPHDAITWDLARNLLARDKEQNWQLLQMPQRLRIQTIDGLCRSLASQLPIESGLGAPGEPLEQTQPAFELAVVNLLKHLDGETPDEDLQRLLLHLDNDLGQLNKLLQMLLEKREQWLGPLLSVGYEGAQDYFHFAIDELVAENLEELASQLKSYTGEILELADFASRNLHDKNPEHPLVVYAGMETLPATDASGLPHWLALINMAVNDKNAARKRVDKRHGFPTAKEHPEADEYKSRLYALSLEVSENTPLLEAFNEARALPTGLRHEQWQLLQSLTQVLPKLVAELKLVFRQLGATDYTEVSQAALIALGTSEEPTDLALKMDVQTKHILVDEFQDTSQMQLELLEKLTAGWEVDDGRTLFIVGDGMQSCYGFRNANVGIFLDARNRGIGEGEQKVPLTPLDLQVNFRSEGAVVEWVNQTFDGAFPPQDNIGRGAVRYLPSHAFKGVKWPGPAVNFYGCIDDGERQAEAQQTTELVRQLQEKDPKGRIAILVRQKNHLEKILPALGAAGIEFQAPELAKLASKMAVLDLLSLTRALLDPSDRISWLSILRAPWCGLQLSDLYSVANWGDDPSTPENKRVPTDISARPLLLALREVDEIPLLSEEGRAHLKRAAAPILRAWEQRGRKPLRTWIEGLWLALGGPASVAHKNDLENVQDFFQLLESHDNGGAIEDWQQFKNALEKLFARPGQDARVQLMTIHKSKGLEFEHVIIPGLDKSKGGNNDQLLRWAQWLNRSGESRILLAPKSPRGDADPLFDFLKHDNSERERLEGTRLLYVGCTRAIRSLHLLACIKHDEKSQRLKSPASAALLASLWPAIPHEEDADWCHWLETPGHEEEMPRSENSNNLLLRLPQEWQAPAIPSRDWLAQYRMPDYLPKESDEEDTPHNVPEQIGQVALRWFRHAGTVTHESLATIAESDLSEWTAEQVLEQQPLWQLRLSQLGLYGSGLEQARGKVEQAILNALNCDTGRWLLDNSHRESACELELHSGGRQLRRSIVDRTFIDTDGTRWIIDYKTAEPAGGDNEEAFVATQLEKYRSQLESYRKLFYARGERQVRCALYFPLLQRLAELDAA